MEETQIKDIKYPEETKRANCKRILNLYAKKITTHNHIWRDTVMPIPKSSKEELLISIRNSGNKGFWLKGKELVFGKELEVEGSVRLCCNDEAATAI